MQNGAVRVGMPQGSINSFIAPCINTVVTMAARVTIVVRVPGFEKVHPMAMAVSTGLNPYSPLAIVSGAAPNCMAKRRPIPDPVMAHMAADRFDRANAAMKNIPVTHELIRNTCDMPFSQYMASEVGEYSAAIAVWITGGSSLNCCDAISTIHVRKTKGNVSELIFHDNIILLSPRCSHVVSMAKNISVTHIIVVLARNAGSAHPTSVPLKPHSPSEPYFLSGYARKPVAVATAVPITAPHPACGAPHSYAPQKIPARNNSPVSAHG